MTWNLFLIATLLSFILLFLFLFFFIHLYSLLPPNFFYNYTQCHQFTLFWLIQHLCHLFLGPSLWYSCSSLNHVSCPLSFWNIHSILLLYFHIPAIAFFTHNYWVGDLFQLRTWWFEEWGSVPFDKCTHGQKFQWSWNIFCRFSKDYSKKSNIFQE